MQENKKDRHEELPIEEFENDNQDIREEFLNKFNKKEEKLEDTKEDKVEKSEKNQIKGGLADHLSVKDIADKHKVDVSKIKEQLTKGVKVEMEHTDDPKKAVEIALDHLVESPIYYDELEKMESKFHDKK